MATRNSVLVLDGDKTAALDIVRSLGARGLTVHVAASCPDAISFRSRFAARQDVYPDPRRSPDAFGTWLEEVLQKHPVDLVIPVTDVTAIPISRRAGRLRRFAALAVESPGKLEIVCDKLKTIELARRVGVPVPRTAMVRCEADLDAVEPLFPLVCKPVRSSVWSERGYEATTVWYAFDEREFRTGATRALATCPLLVQEYRRGVGVGVEVLARNGELIQVFQHRRLHELPITGGGSTYRVSEAVDPMLRDYSSRLIAALRWTGVAMVEFRLDPTTRQAVLMEINGRFWGSLPVATRAGVPFASALYDLLVLGRAAAPRRYRVGLRCRRLAGDLEWLKEMARLSPDDRIVRRGLVAPASKSSLVRDVARLLSPAERYDVQMWTDPIPGALDLLSVGREQAAMVRRMAARAATPLWSAAYRACFRQSALNKAARARRVLFICHGNIMRSAFAAAYLRQRAPATLDIEPASAGDYPRSGRPADPRMLDAARQWGVDLSPHRSRVVDAEMVRWADVILVMDRKNREALRHLPEAAGKVHFLGLLDPAAASVEIGDPYCEDDRAAAVVCESIAAAVDELVNRAARRVADERRDDARLRTPRGALR